jgi:hypothetical protein
LWYCCIPSAKRLYWRNSEADNLGKGLLATGGAEPNVVVVWVEDILKLESDRLKLKLVVDGR